MTTLAVVGLGYVGLPLAVAFSATRRVIGYDAAPAKVAALRAGVDPTGEVGAAALAGAVRLEPTDDPAALAQAQIVIVAVPTPIDAARRPDLAALRAASGTVGRHLRQGATVVYESTVYPGCTEEECVPLLERASGLRWREDFHVGYSPERINPGDRAHGLADVVKVVAGDDADTARRLAMLYGEVVRAGIHVAPSIAVAEAAKAIENTQRDLNIALMNELAIIFGRLGLDTADVLAAAGTKWNFLPFRPGLVGGHCIGVDPYYLTHKAESAGYHPQVILAGRRINDAMGRYVAEQTVKALVRGGTPPGQARVNVLGLTFKEDCPDLRNSRVADLVDELRAYGASVAVHDPLADAAEAAARYGTPRVVLADLPPADAVVLAVPHRVYRDCPVPELLASLRPGGCVVDVKSVLDRAALAALGAQVWRL
jgi:UDP-N-acetyl-D-glucosamine/UDP-N-acetyl-D-galactosamine dehydrogenase